VHDHSADHSEREGRGGDGRGRVGGKEEEEDPVCSILREFWGGGATAHPELVTTNLDLREGRFY